MTTNAFVGNVFLEREKSGSPNEYTRMCEVFGISGLGQVNALIDATTFCSGGSREYIGGLADGTEVTLECNFETGSTAERSLIASVAAKETLGFRLAVDDGSPTMFFTFDAVCLSWTFNPSVDDRNTISFGLKVSGDIVIS